MKAPHRCILAALVVCSFAAASPRAKFEGQVVSAVGSATSPSSQASSPGPSPPAAPATVGVTLELTRAPPARIVCSFSSKKHAIKPQVEFLGRSVDGLAQGLVLDGAVDDWRVGCAMEPFKREVSPDVGTGRSSEARVFPAASARELLPDADVQRNLEIQVSTDSSGKADGSAPETWTVEVRKLDAGGAPHFGPSTASRADLRSLDAIGEVAGELAKIIAEIAVKRARTAAYEVVRKRLVKACDGGAEENLAQTCAAVRALRVQDLTGALTTLRDAAVVDLVGVAVTKLPRDKDHVSLSTYLSHILTDGARRGVVEADPRGLLRAAQSAGTQDLKKAISLVEICMQTAYSCTAEDTWRVLDAHRVTLSPKERAAVDALLGALLAPPSEPPRQRAARTVDAAFAVLAAQSSADPDGLDDVQALASALVRDDIPRLIAIGAKMLPSGSSQKLTRVAGTVAAYAATFQTSPSSPEDRKRQHEVRKELVSGLVDSLTDRSDRAGDWVVSLGVLPSLTYGVQWTKSDSYETRLPPPQLALPAGAAIQYLPSDECRFGVHFSFSPIDVGQYLAIGHDDGDVSVSEPSWASAATAAVQAGLLVGEPGAAFFVGVDARYSPAVFSPGGDPTKGGGAGRVGLMLGYYVPLLDLN